MAVKQPDRHTTLREHLIDAAERTIAEKGLAALKARDLALEVRKAHLLLQDVALQLGDLTGKQRTGRQ